MNSSNGFPIGDYWADGSNNQGYNCAPINRKYFLGWTNLFNVYNAILGAAKGLVTVYEFETQEEFNTQAFTVLTRYMYDNSMPQSAWLAAGQIVDVVSNLRSLMSANGFDPGRVIWSAFWTDPSTSATYNCGNVYVDYARNFGLDTVTQAVIGVPSGPVAQGQVTTDASGEFLVVGLPPGNYALCANVASAAYLDPSTWQQPIRVTIPPGGSVSQTVILTKGVFLKVRVNDPMGLLPQTVDGVWTSRKLLVGVQYARGAYQGAQNTGVDAGGHDYQLVIPTGQPFKLRLFSRDVALKDVGGNALDISGSQIPFQAEAGRDRAFTFTVSGPASP